MKSFLSLLAFLLLVWLIGMIGECQAWFASPSMSSSRTSMLTTSTSTTSLHYSNDETTDDNPKRQEEDTHVERIQISGVSVSTKGFHVLLQTSKGILPLAVTKDPLDSYQATSAESLTLLQLLSQVDMAGAVLPPELLSQMAIVKSELELKFEDAKENNNTANNNNNNHSSSSILARYMQRHILPPECPTYKDAHPWFQSRMSLPQITLDQLLLVLTETGEVKCQLTCALPKSLLWLMEEEEEEDNDDVPCPSSCSSFVVDVTPELVESFAYQYNPETSHIFTSLALALRYKAPIVLQDDSSSDSHKTYCAPELLERDFPQRTTLQNLQRQSSRISQNIETGFQVHKLMGALQIAKRLGDTAAIQKIQDKLEEYDRMDDLPVVGEDHDPKNNHLDTTNRVLEEDSDSNAFQ